MRKLLMLPLLLGLAAGAETTRADEAPPPRPKASEAQPAAKAVVVVKPAPVQSAAQPTLDIPPEVRPVGQYVQFTPKTTAVSVLYVGRSGVDAVPSQLLKDGRVFLLDSRGLNPGRYEFTAVGAGATGEQSRADFAVVIGSGTAPPVTDPKLPPPDPIEPTPTKLYFLVVRADGPAAPAFTKTMSDPAWAALRLAGHSVKDKSATEAAALGVVLAPAQLPAVVTLRVSPDGKTSGIVRPAIPLPTTGPAIADLPNIR